MVKKILTNATMTFMSRMVYVQGLLYIDDTILVNVYTMYTRWQEWCR